MSYFRLYDYNELTSDKARNVYDEIVKELGFGIVPNIFRSMAIRPDFLEASWNEFRSTVLHGYLPRTLKEMIGIAISQHNSSEYALRVHLHGLSALGISEEVLRMLVSDFENCPLPEREKAVIAFGLKAATDPQGVDASDYDHLRSFGLNDEEIFEIVATARLFHSVNMYTDAIGLEIDAL